MAISRDFWRFRLGKMTGYPLDSLETLKQLKKYQGKIYDIGLLNTFIAHCNNINETPKETRQPIGNLIPGMTLKGNLYGHQHTLLLSKGHELTENCIRKLKRLERLRGKKILLRVNNNENLALSETLT